MAAATMATATRATMGFFITSLQRRGLFPDNGLAQSLRKPTQILQQLNFNYNYHDSRVKRSNFTLETGSTDGFVLERFMLFNLLGFSRINPNYNVRR
jgi:hypothetical protein